MPRCRTRAKLPRLVGNGSLTAYRVHPPLAWLAAEARCRCVYPAEALEYIATLAGREDGLVRK